MRKYLPFVIPAIAALLFLAAGYFYIQSSKSTDLAKPTGFSFSENGLREVPKNLPDQVRIENLEDSTSLLIDELNDLKASLATASSETQNSASVDYKLKALETSILELKARVSALEKPAAASTTASKPPLYIPLGSSGGPWYYNDWTTLTEYQVSINPDDYAGYSGVQLEVNNRLIEAGGTGSVRLYNSTDSSAVGSQIDITSSEFGYHASGSFKLASGAKTYTLQIKVSPDKHMLIQSARIKVNF